MLEIDISTRSRCGSVIVDDEDAHLLERWKWTPDESGYAHRKGDGNRKVYLHRQIAGAQPGEVVDHINRDRRDCRRSNLRLVTQAENIWNKAGRGATSFKGVWRKRDKWAAGITKGDSAYSLGVYASPDEAALAYDAAALALGYDRSGLNFPGRDTAPRLEPVSRDLAPHGRPGIRLLSSGTYNVRVMREGKRIGLGTFQTLAEAIEAWESRNG